MFSKLGRKTSGCHPSIWLTWRTTRQRMLLALAFSQNAFENHLRRSWRSCATRAIRRFSGDSWGPSVC